MWPIGFMAWRIGEILDLDAQIDWIREAGFEAIGLHASAGNPGQWQGIGLAALNRHQQRHLRHLITGFERREIHAPFELTLSRESLAEMTPQIEGLIEAAGAIGADIFTVHAEFGTTNVAESAEWQRSLDRLAQCASGSGVVLGFELMDGFEYLGQPCRENLGVTLDVGHMVLRDGESYRPYGTLGGLVRSVGSLIVHLHIHDYDGTHDHIELGHGQVDYPEVLMALAEIGYKGGMCLELNPDRVSPCGIQRSLQHLRSAAYAAHGDSVS